MNFTLRIHKFLSWLRGREAVVLFSLLVMILAAWSFIEIADEVQEGSTRTFDEWAVMSFRNPNDLSDPIGPKWVQQSAMDISALGGSTVLLIVTLVLMGYMILVRRYHIMVLVAASAIGGTVLSYLLKEVFSRDRPTIVEHLAYATTPSFPSGHAMMSATVYLTLGALMTRVVAERRAKTYFLGSALILTCAIGITRVFLGVHYPTDVLAGWCAGLTWALLCWEVARALQRRGVVEPPVQVDNDSCELARPE